MKQQFAAKHPWTILAAGAAIQVLTGLLAAWGVFQQPWPGAAVHGNTALDRP